MQVAQVMEGEKRLEFGFTSTTSELDDESEAHEDDEEDDT